MAFITDILNTIKNARKGKDMRQAIYDGIQQCYEDATGHPDSVAAVVERLKIEKGRIDELATSQTFTGNYTQSNLVFHAYRNATTGDPDPDDSYNYEGTSGKHEMPICKIFQEGTLDFAEKQSNEKVKILKEGLYIFELRIFISGSGKLDIEARINDVSQRYNAWQIVAQSTEETKIIAYILYLKGDDVVSFYGTPGLQASVRAPVSDVNCYVLDWIGKAQISDCSKEISDIRVGADGNTYPTAGEAIREQIGNLTEDIGDRNVTLNFKYDGYIDETGELNNQYPRVFKATDFIAVSDSVVVEGEFGYLDKPHHYIHCYDINKNYLGGVIVGVTSNDKVITLNDNVTLIDDTCFIRVTNGIPFIEKIKMSYSLSDTGNLSLINQKINQKTEEIKTNNIIYNSINDGLGFSVFSKFASVGDSLSVGYNTEKDGTQISKDLNHSWGAYIEKRYGTKSFWTGESGQTCKTWLNSTSDTWGLKYCKSIGTMPLYVICMGANESGINIGTTDDIDTDNDSLYGYVSKVINELRKISPKSYILCTGVSRKQNSADINNVYKTICGIKEKCYYLDCFKEFNSEPLASYYFNFHYSANGYSAIANLFDYKLKEVMTKNIEDFKYINEADN